MGSFTLRNYVLEPLFALRAALLHTLRDSVRSRQSAFAAGEQAIYALTVQFRLRNCSELGIVIFVDLNSMELRRAREIGGYTSTETAKPETGT